MEVLIEKKMIDIKSEPVELVTDQHHHHHSKSSRRRPTSPPSELEPCEEFPILYGLLTAPKSFKPKNSEELQFLPMSLPPSLLVEQEDEQDDFEDNTTRRHSGGLVVTSRVQLVQCRQPSRNHHRAEVVGMERLRRRRRSSECEEVPDAYDDDDDDNASIMEEADSQNLDFCSSSSSSRSRSSSRSSPHHQAVDSSSNLSTPGRGAVGGGDENNSPSFRNALRGSANNENNNRAHHSHNNSNRNSLNERGDAFEDDMGAHSPGGASSTSGGDDPLDDDNIPTSTTSGFKRKATRLETAIGNIVRRRGRVQKRTNHSNSSVPISMAPSSPTVSTTCVDPPAPTPPLQQQQQPTRGRSEILERILRSTTTNTVNPAAPQQQPLQSPPFPARNDNNNDGGYEPYAKLRDLLTMSEDQLVKRRRLEYGLSENKLEPQEQQQVRQRDQPNRRRDFSPPRNNILASLLQKGREPYDPYHHQHSPNGILRNPPALMSINKLSDTSSCNNDSNNDDRPYKCSLCDLRFKKLPLLNRHVKTHSHIKRYVCRFCSHAFKRSDNLLAHMRTSCKGIKESDAKFAGVGPPAPIRGTVAGQIIPQLLSSPPTGGPVSPMVSRSQLEEALLNIRAMEGGEGGTAHQEKRYSSPSPLVSTTTASPPPAAPPRLIPAVRARPLIQPGHDFQSRHSKLLEILSGSPVIAHNPHHHHHPSRFLDNGDAPEKEVEEEDDDMPLPLSLKVERRSSSPHPVCSSSSSVPNQSQFRRSQQHHPAQPRDRAFYSKNKMNELPDEEEVENEVETEMAREIPVRRGYAYEALEEEENDNDQPLYLGRPSNNPAPPLPPAAVQSARGRDHPEIVSILSRQPKNVVMMEPDLRKLVGLDAL